MGGYFSALPVTWLFVFPPPLLLKHGLCLCRKFTGRLADWFLLIWPTDTWSRTKKLGQEVSVCSTSSPGSYSCEHHHLAALPQFVKKKDKKERKLLIWFTLLRNARPSQCQNFVTCVTSVTFCDPLCVPCQILVGWSTVGLEPVPQVVLQEMVSQG